MTAVALLLVVILICVTTFVCIQVSHVTRDIKQDGSCPACTESIREREARREEMRKLAEIQERDKQDRIRREEERKGKKC